MGDWFPGKYERNWVDIWLLSTVFFWFFWIGAQLFILHKVPNPKWLLGILMLSMTSFLVVCCSGFFGRKLLFFSSVAGIAVGLTLNLTYYFYGNAWADLAGLVAYIEFAAIGTLVGTVGELMMLLFRKRRE